MKKGGKIAEFLNSVMPALYCVRSFDILLTAASLDKLKDLHET